MHNLVDLAQWHPVKENQYKQSHYKKYEHRVKAKGVRFPTPIVDISKIERKNMSIHVFVFYENGSGFNFESC